MKEQLPLNELFQGYAAGCLGRKDFEGRVFQYILDNHRRFRLYDWTREQCSDYLSWLYPRLSRAIDLYRDRGSSFDAYIASMVYWSSREYRTRMAARQVTEYTCWKARAEESEEVRSPEPEYAAPLPPAQKFSNPRQILILILKSYFFVSEDFLDRAAPALGMETERLRHLVEELRERRLKREEEVRGLRERIHGQYYRCLSFERKLASLPEGSILYERMRDRLNRGRVRLAAMKARLAGIRLDPTNGQIAEVLRIPKGTVASNLHALREKWRTPVSQDAAAEKPEGPENPLVSGGGHSCPKGTEQL
jgi:hypothetical protein